MSGKTSLRSPPCVTYPFVDDKHHTPQTSRWITALPKHGRMVIEGGRKGRGKPVKYHICIKMPSWGSQHRARYFQGCLFKGSWSVSSHAGIAPYTFPIIYGPHLAFTGPPRWGRGGMRHSSLLLEQHVPNDVTGVRELLGVGWRLQWRAVQMHEGGSGLVGDEGLKRGQWYFITRFTGASRWSWKLDWRCSAVVSPFASLPLLMHCLQQREKTHPQVYKIRNVTAWFGPWSGHCVRKLYSQAYLF